MNLKTNLTKFNFKAGGNAIKYLVIHDTGNKNDSDEGNAKYFSVDGRKASAHYFVDDDSCTQLVKDIDIAWHVGDGKGLYGIITILSVLKCVELTVLSLLKLKLMLLNLQFPL